MGIRNPAAEQAFLEQQRAASDRVELLAAALLCTALSKPEQLDALRALYFLAKRAHVAEGTLRTLFREFIDQEQRPCTK